MQLTTREKGIPIYLYEIVELELEGLVQIDCINNVLTITESDAKLSENGYTYEYSDDNGESWNQYTGETIVSQKDEVIIRLVNTNDKKVITEKVLASKDVNYVTSISIKTPPDNTTYAQGQSFDTSGMVVMATYQDNTTSVITNYQYSPTGPLTVDDTIVTITYTEKGVTKTVTQSITVTNNVESITIVDPATDLDYRQGESFNTSGMIVKATYQDGTESEITNYRVIPNGQLSASDTSVTISYTYGDVTK